MDTVSALFDWWIQRQYEEHLTIVLVRQQEQPQHGGHWNFVVERFTVQLEEGGEHFDVIPTTG